MKIAMAQINSFLGDFKANREKILKGVVQAQALGADMVVFPEAALFGYHPCDLLERYTIVQAQMAEFKILCKELPKGIAVLLGAIGFNDKKEGKAFTNSAVFLENGKKPKWFSKQLLPTYDVFDESRHIQPGSMVQNVLKWKGKKILITICEDIWAWPHPGAMRSATYLKNPLQEVKKPIDLVLNLSASPFTQLKLKQRSQVVQKTARWFKAPMLYVNLVGGQDELIFDGASFAVDSSGKTVVQCERFKEDIQIVNLDWGKKIVPSTKQNKTKLEKNKFEILRESIVLGMRDFAHKNGFERFHLGLSGGIDSAVVACLAVDALGHDRVSGFALPGPFSADESFSLAGVLAKNLKIEFKSFNFQDLYIKVVDLIESQIGQIPFGVMHENIQARIRALILMSVANHQSSLLLATSNKCELATGYSTLYGDMCGSLMPIGDLLKGEVYGLAEHYNRHQDIIPKRIIERPPTAELRPNQKDQDSLPPYSELDQIVLNLVENYKPAKTHNEVEILNKLMKSEFKRWQSPPVLKLSAHGFGRGRRLPVAHRAGM